MPTTAKSGAVTVALAHVDAWSNHDYPKARTMLAPDVTVTATSTNPQAPKTDLVGADAYMEGLKMFADNVVPGSARILETTGDDHNALVMLTLQTAAGAFGPSATLPGARLYLLDDNEQIKAEQVVFFLSYD